MKTVYVFKSVIDLWNAMIILGYGGVFFVMSGGVFNDLNNDLNMAFLI